MSGRAPGPSRRRLLAGGAAFAWPALVPAQTPQETALRQAVARGGVLMLRHALAPGTFDPPGFRLGDCATQRNLSDEGRAQARRVGGWFATRGWRPVRVRSSPWCRCLETARLAFGDRVESWDALGSPHDRPEVERARALAQLREGVAEAMARGAGLEVWVTHMFVFGALLGEGADVGEGVLMDRDAAGAPRVVVRVAGLAGG